VDARTSDRRMINSRFFDGITIEQAEPAGMAAVSP
jgi:hypothetical protein